MADKGAVAVKGLRELIRSFDVMDHALTTDLVDEIVEAADPVRKLTEQYITGGGGGFPGMRGVVGQWDYVKEMRIGVSRRQAEVYIAPAWRRDGSRPQLAMQLRWRMEGALEDKADEIEKRLGDFLDVLADHWGSYLAA